MLRAIVILIILMLSFEGKAYELTYLPAKTPIGVLDRDSLIVPLKKMELLGT